MAAAVVNPRRVRLLKDGARTDGPVAYWMSRDQRVHDNWALIYAQELAMEQHKPLMVIFCLVSRFLGATMRQYAFMLKGLEEVAAGLTEINIPLYLEAGLPEQVVPAAVQRFHISTVVTDFDPLKIKRSWKKRVAERITVPFVEVDAHNVVPCWIASPKQDFAARTFRPRITGHLSEFLDDFPLMKRHPLSFDEKVPRIRWRSLCKELTVNRAVSNVTWLEPGGKAALSILRSFMARKLASYGEVSNDPTRHGQSNLSPYLHFGQIAAQRVALEVIKSPITGPSRERFLEELIIRRELSDNFCFYNDNYDKSSGFPTWATKTLREHGTDKREYLYTAHQFENAETHDDLWNAAQMEMVKRGKMHGYMRMYWAKKILEWSKTPEDALGTALYLNDRYELDGRDPNGYAGCAWSIGGVHDRAWFQRPVFGKIRYMSYNGCKSKFNVTAYIDQVNSL
ncbi:MAG TPA: deoxyribodipyrimidine photo-lyase [Deltaproteobacteria bacterium]|nr:deoxyribodipyrimidine photo-lyase [Deltaproteobacteria bacterium]